MAKNTNCVRDIAFATADNATVFIGAPDRLKVDKRSHVSTADGSLNCTEADHSDKRPGKAKGDIRVDCDLPVEVQGIGGRSTTRPNPSAQ
ncbi:MAG TPA: hypothetical protein VFP92_09500 [Rhodanobacteraceae bacterium]|nr:hypothetical protein [Rhodanobacteraceae bacterium]